MEGSSSLSPGGQSGDNQERHHRFTQFVKIFAERFKNKFSSSGESTNVSSMNVKPSGTGSAETHPRKRALLCGVTYKNKKYKLKGTVNDVKSMRNFLIDKYDYPEECIRVLTEEEEENFSPTKKNIQESLKWLVEGSESGDSLVFYFSGHGLRQPDFNDDERDGFDETICPVDFMQEGMILDNEINSTIVWPLKEGVTLHAIVDACHSGTILDLEHVYNRERNEWEDNSAPSKARKSTSGGIAICLSACEDDKMAADTTAFTGKAMAGAMTYLMIETVRNNAEVTYGLLLDKMHEMVEQFNNKSCLGKFLPGVLYHRKIQNALLSSSETFDVYEKKFLL
ncbi:metacaspase-1-like isoform X2 [Quercus robur]|uniref:metacaspase-1-like isoform X2 n=1 Tax=Quercus robur TaxID=38942 RepID=UPI002161C5C6|nr:metacaspase-1-like isoform X2 [Quercus robur]